MIFDLTTLYLVSAMVTGTSGLLFLIDIRGRADASLRWWGLAFLCAITPAVVYAVAAQSPALEVLNPLANGLVVSGAALLWVGARAFNGKFTQPALWLVPAVSTMILPFIFEQPVTTWKGFLLLVGWVVVFNLLAAYECWRPVAPRLRNQTVLAIAWALGAVFYAGRFVAFALFGPDDPRFLVMFGSEAATICVLLLIVISSFSMVALGKERSELALKHAAMHDGLTGVLNRATFTRMAETDIDRLAQAGQPLSVLLIDLDHFKRINDTHGHAAGDEVLRQAATAMSRCLGTRDLFCRYGGEEFAAMLSGAAPDVAEVVAQRMLRAIRMSVGSTAMPVTGSIGIASAMAGETGLDGLLRNADVALYRAKREGRDRADTFHAAGLAEIKTG